jgi:hypothetical protein
MCKWDLNHRLRSDDRRRRVGGTVLAMSDEYVVVNEPGTGRYSVHRRTS